MKSRNLILHLIFLVIAVVQLYGSWIESRTLEYIAKPLILLWIAVFFLLNTRPTARRWLVVLAFFFSWIGDLLLMFAWKNDLFFFAGVGSFFCSQVTYILVFLTYRLAPGRGLIQLKPVWVIPFILYFGLLYSILLPDLEGMMIPVVSIYAVTLIGMSIAAVNRHGRVKNREFVLVMSGALMFLVSDSLLAINKFVTEIPRGGFLVILTYIAAQYLIMRGLAGECKDD